VPKDVTHSILDSMELGDSDVLLHTSIINIGDVKGGAKFIANEIMNKVDVSKNTLLVSALPFRGAFKEYLSTNPIFDVRTAPVAMGAVNEYIADLPNAKRSIHPTHSVVAVGPKADYYTSEHQLDDTPFGIHSPYYKLLKNRGKILLFGATLNNMTFLHVIEDIIVDLFPIKIYDKKIYNCKCIDDKGNEVIVKTLCHNALAGMRRDLTFTHDDLINKGIMRSYEIGESEVCLLNSFDFSKYYIEMLSNGLSIYGKYKLNERLKLILSEINL
jgi:aminoglycoside 3-N-acetyltransferase